MKSFLRHLTFHEGQKSKDIDLTFIFRRCKSEKVMQPVTARAKPIVNERHLELDRHMMDRVINPEVKDLTEQFRRNGFDLKIVGGAVRDLLLDYAPADLDMATDAPPSFVKKVLLECPGVRFTEQKGSPYGNTKIILNGQVIDITSLRVDIQTDGRHAIVEHTKDWALDATRRDFTCNAMYLSPVDGILTDYFDGEADLRCRRLRFVGDPDTRVKEDYLRILRYFRYHLIVCDASVHDPGILDIIRANASGLTLISPKRRWVEFSRILSSPFAHHALNDMLATGVATHLGLGSITVRDIERFAELHGTETHPLKKLKLIANNDLDTVDSLCKCLGITGKKTHA